MSDTDRSVLVVDDFATMARIMKGIVGQLGYTDIDVCENGEAALEKLKARTYDFILSDLEMEPMTGAEFAARARARPYLVRCPIIITTASRDSAAQCVRDGLHEVVDGFILKPFMASDLRVKLLEIQNRKRARKFGLDGDEAAPPLQPNDSQPAPLR